MVEKGLIQEIFIEGERRSIKRYLTKPNPSPYEIACSLQSHGYFSHLTAAYLHELIIEEPTMITVSTEGPKRETSDYHIDQEKIDAAFQKPQRQSGAKMQWGDKHFLLLNGSFAGGAGIDKNSLFSLTSIERTLIDLTVRPAYGGSALNVAQIYRKAISVLNIDNIFKLLDKLSYKYPYHQNIGFYLSLAGYNDREKLGMLKKRGISRTFYLEYEMIEPIYSDEWNLFFPPELLSK